jgi:hypothetical protein
MPPRGTVLGVRGRRDFSTFDPRPAVTVVLTVADSVLVSITEKTFRRALANLTRTGLALMAVQYCAMPLNPDPVACISPFHSYGLTSTVFTVTL